MIDVVLDASVLMKWFKSAGEENLARALDLYDRFSQGELRVVAPPLVFLEVLNSASRRWGWSARQIEVLATDLNALGLEIVQPSLDRVAYWCCKGLSAYDAAYVALAEERQLIVVTADAQIVKVAGPIALALTTFALE